jgi:hypothetical protein
MLQGKPAQNSICNPMLPVMRRHDDTKEKE